LAQSLDRAAAAVRLSAPGALKPLGEEAAALREQEPSLIDVTSALPAIQRRCETGDPHA
jgi:hypothetical protein